jgi:hypothetical protein
MTGADTQAVFGHYIWRSPPVAHFGQVVSLRSICYIQRDFADKATVLIHNKCQILTISLNAAESATLWRFHLKKGRSFDLRFIRFWLALLDSSRSVGN